MSRRNNRVKIFRNWSLMLLAIIVISVLSYDGYNHFFGSKVKTNKAMSANKTISSSDAKKQPPKKVSKWDKIHSVSEEGKKYVYDAQKVKDILDNKSPDDGKKIAFLTFDDGPSTTVTPIVLDTLKRYDVKATFCLLGQNIERNEKSKSLVKRIFKEGHAIANHTYSHDMKKLYPGNQLDVDYCMQEVEKNNNVIRGIVGQDFNTRVLRLPGGYMSRVYYHDPNLNEFNQKLKEKDMYSIDWNALNCDAEGRRKDAPQLVECLKENVGSKQKVVILMHDTYGKRETARALPEIIEYLRSQGYEFKTIA